MKLNSKTFLLEDEIEWESVGDGIRRQILGYDDKLMLVKVEFQAGAIGAGHAHAHSQSTYVVSGRFEFFVEGEKKTVNAGDGIYVAPNAFHGTTCLESGVLMDAFSPVRADFLKE